MTTKPLIGNFNSVGDTNWAKSDGSSIGSIDATTGVWTLGQLSFLGTHLIRGNLSQSANSFTLTAASLSPILRVESTVNSSTPEILVDASGASGVSPAMLSLKGNGNSGNFINSAASRPLYFIENGVTATPVASMGGGIWNFGPTSASTSGTHTFFAKQDNTFALNIQQGVISGSNVNGLFISYSASAPNDAANRFIMCVDSSATRMTVRNNGGIANYQANDVNLSDERLKTNIVPTSNKLHFICSLQVKDFEYKDNLGVINTGLIAQDVEALEPSLVTDLGSTQLIDGEEVNPKTIRTTEIYHMMIKAIQELKAELDSAKARITELEGN